MKKQLRLVAAFLAALVAILVGASAAQAYPGPVFSLTVNHHVVHGGHPFDATAKSDVTCSNWTINWLGQSASASGKVFTHTFSTPVVHHKQTHSVTAQCTYSASAGAAGTAIRVVDLKSPVLSTHVTLLPRKGSGGGGGNGNGNGNGNGGGNGILPNTGGPAFWLLIAALLLVVAGLSAMARNRRRHHDSGSTPSA